MGADNEFPVLEKLGAFNDAERAKSCQSENKLMTMFLAPHNLAAMSA
jgi:hypothetical protein